MTVGRICDLIMWWLMEGLDDEDRETKLAELTRPPRGYTGSLAGTPWDEAAMLRDFDAAQEQLEAL